MIVQLGEKPGRLRGIVGQVAGKGANRTVVEYRRIGAFAARFTEIVEAADPIEVAGLARQLEFLAELAVEIFADKGPAAGRRAGQIETVGSARLAIGGDRLHLDAVEVPVERAADRACQRPVEQIVDFRVTGARTAESLPPVGSWSRGRSEFRVDVGAQRRIGARLGEVGEGTGGNAERPRRARCDGAVLDADRGRRERRQRRRRVDRGDGGGIAVIVVQRIVAGQREGQRHALWRPFDRGAEEIVVLHLALLLAEGRVREITVVVVVATGETHREFVAERHVDHAFDLLGLEVAVTDLDQALEAIDRLVRGDVERAARRVAAEQRALRPAQHFGTGDVEETQIADDRPGDIDAIDIDADRGIGHRVRAVLRLAADGEIDDRRRAGAAGADRKRRCRTLQIGYHQNLLALQAGIVQRGYRDRDGLQILRRTARRDDDIVETAARSLLDGGIGGGRRRGLGHCRGKRQTGAQRHGRRRNQDCPDTHKISP